MTAFTFKFIKSALGYFNSDCVEVMACKSTDEKQLSSPANHDGGFHHMTELG